MSYNTDDLKYICRLLGCSGVDNKCPGNEQCSIIIKILGGRNELHA